MEHIYSCTKNLAALRVPCLVNITTNPYVFEGSWTEYPKERGLDLKAVRFHQWPKFPPNQLAAFLQEWLFFALLRAILPREIELDVNEFIREDENGLKFIKTDKLDEYLRLWVEIYNTEPDEIRLEAVKENVKILNEASVISCSLCSLPKAPNLALFPPIPLECALSCAMLGEALSITHNTLLIGQPWDPVPAGDAEKLCFSRAWGRSELLAEELERQGWCPFIAEGVEAAHEMPTLYYFTTLGGPEPLRDHAGCTEKLCSLTQNDAAQHAGGCDGSCGMLAPPVPKIANAIRTQSTPVLKYQPASENTQADIAVSLAADNVQPYVAISHVWCDGLGYPGSNKLYNCQAKRVQAAVDRLFQDRQAQTTTSAAPKGQVGSSGAWWLDTLCVPQGDSYKDEKDMAIAQMKSLYERATAVLVIDSGLCMCADNISVLEILARFRLSNWIRRLWTFQESYFAQSLYLLVGSTPRSWQSLIDVANKLPIDRYQKRIAWDLFNRSFNFLAGPRPPVQGALTVNAPQPDPDACSHPALNKSAHPAGMAATSALLHPADYPITERLVGTIIQELKSRTASCISDEAQCLSLLLGLDTGLARKAVVAELGDKSCHTPSEAGMVALLTLADAAARRPNRDMEGCFPPSIIFPPGQRLRTPGFQWAPRSVLRGSGADLWPRLILGYPLEVRLGNGTTVQRPSGMLCGGRRGLRVMFPGLLLTHIDSVRPAKGGFIVDTTGARPPPEKFMPPFWCCSSVVDGNGRAWEGGNAPVSTDSGDLAIIIGAFSGLDMSTSMDACLVRVLDKGPKGEYAVKRLCRLGGYAPPAYVSLDWLSQSKRVEGRWLPLNQMWCVD